LQVTALIRDAAGFPSQIGSTANRHLAVPADEVAAFIVKEACREGQKKARAFKISADADGNISWALLIQKSQQISR